VTAPAGRPPAAAGWRAGDPGGRRRFVDLPGPLPLEAGGTLPAVRLAYETWGALSPSRDNAVLICHALTGDSHVAGPAGPGHPTSGWWDAVVGPGKALDTDRWFVVAPNVLGGCQGSTGPSSAAPDGRPWGSRFPFLTIRDQVAAEASLADALGVGRWAAVLGGSMGGMRALEWAATYPSRVAALLVLAAPAQASAEQIAWSSPQLHAVRSDPCWHGGDYAATGRAPGGSRTSRTAANRSSRPGSAVRRSAGRTRGAAAGTPSSRTSTTTRTSWCGGSTRAATSRSSRR
jgi:homoserine O-acetyltransferase